MECTPAKIDLTGSKVKSTYTVTGKIGSDGKFKAENESLETTLTTDGKPGTLLKPGVSDSPGTSKPPGSSSVAPGK